jgi:hypothetical protein
VKSVRKSSGWMRGLSRKQVSAAGGLWVRVPRLPLVDRVLLAERQRHPASNRVRRVRLPQSILGQIRGSASGGPPAFDAGDEGSNPSPRTCEETQSSMREQSAGQSRLVATPGSEPGGVGSIPTPAITITKSRGPAATTPGLHPGNDGSSPSGTTHVSLRVDYPSARIANTFAIWSCRREFFR